jgi:hypothetical protein
MGKASTAAVSVALAAAATMTVTAHGQQAAASPSSAARSGGAGEARAEHAVAAAKYEVWTVDQTDSRPGHGGYLHIYDGRDLAADASAAAPRTVDLGAAASDLCLARTGARPVRPHMLAFAGERPGSNRFAVVAWVVSGHVLILDAASRSPVACMQMSAGAGGARQAHAAWPTPDQKWLIVANQNGKLLERIRTDWTRRSFVHEHAATLDLAEGSTPSGAARQDPVLRPDNAPICPRTTRDGRFAFVSLRGGGAFVVDHTTTPMRIVAEYDVRHVGDNGCGQVQAGDRMYVNAGAGAPGRPHASEVSVFPLAGLRAEGTPSGEPAPSLAYSRGGQVDAHGMAVTRDDRYVLVGDRAQNDVTVIDTATDRPVNRFSLQGVISEDPAPDLFDLSPDGTVLFASLRGPTPLSGGHDAVGSTPGVGVIQLREGGRAGELTGHAPVQRSDGKAPDPHAIQVRLLVP